MAIDYDEVSRCLDEVEAELFRISDCAECEKFHRDSQLTAVILLLLRCSSLIRSMTHLLQGNALVDGFHLVARGFEETWNLANDLRLASHSGRATKWLAEVNDSWVAKLRTITEFAIGRGLKNPSLKQDYGLLSELSHPTRSAAQNSVTMCGIRQEFDGSKDQVKGEQGNCEKRVTTDLYKLLWLTLDQDTKFIPIPVNIQNMTVSNQFVKNYRHVEPAA